MDTKIDLTMMSAEAKSALLAQLQSEAKKDKVARRENYEQLRREFMNEVASRLDQALAAMREFRKWLEGETNAFVAVMREYGETKTDQQRNFTITEGDFRLQVASNTVKGFDERAEMAAERLIAFLKDYVKRSEKGEADPMYKLAMTLLERNERGDLDYKSISKLYEMEQDFGGEYADIMQLFKESNVEKATTLNYYFFRREADGAWSRVEPSFCRM